MVSPIGLYGMMLSTARMHDAGYRVQAINQSRAGLANSASPNMSMGQVANLASMDKALQLQSLNSQVMFQANQMMAEGTRKMMKKNTQLQERLMKAGAVFA